MRRANARAIVAAAWVSAAVTSLGVASVTGFGPVVLRLTSRHGVHAGDVLVVVLATVLALAVSRALLR